jgi:predicted RNA-binding protein YlxR (DUF448 family)
LQLETGTGRSAYLCPNPDCLKAAQKKNRLSRALKATVPSDIYDALWQKLTVLSADATNHGISNRAVEFH